MTVPGLWWGSGASRAAYPPQLMPPWFIALDPISASAHRNDWHLPPHRDRDHAGVVFPSGAAPPHGGSDVAARRESWWPSVGPYRNRAIEMGGTWPAVVGLAVGGLFITRLINSRAPPSRISGRGESRRHRTSWHRAVLLMVAITIHTISRKAWRSGAHLVRLRWGCACLGTGDRPAEHPEGLEITLRSAAKA